MKKENIFPIAIGTYGLGASRNESWEDNNNELYEQGQSFIETSYIYAGGQTMKFISEFFKKGR